MSEQTTGQNIIEPRKRSGKARKQNDPDVGPLRVFIKTRRDQASVLWDVDTEQAIASFSRRGICRTRSKAAAERLEDEGYVEVLPGQKLSPTPMAEPDPRLADLVNTAFDEDEANDDFDLTEVLDG